MALLQRGCALAGNRAEIRSGGGSGAVADLVVPGLAVKRADTGIKVEGVRSQAVQLVDGARAEVDAGGRGASQIEFLRRDVGQRIEEDVDDAAGAVAQGGGAEDRQNEVDRKSTRLNSSH